LRTGKASATANRSIAHDDSPLIEGEKFGRIKLNQTVDRHVAANIFNLMVEQSDRLDRVFRALSDRTRRAMLRRLARGEQTVTELAAPHRMSLAAASKHIQTLEKAGLVKRTVRGRIHYCRIDPRPLERADDWLRGYERLWDTRIERLAELLRHPDNDDPSHL
jgi:DNA-binding transcriptional ArsR family regulator